MVAKELDEDKLKQELIQLYEKFIENPKDRGNLSEMDKMEQDYSGAHEFIKSNAIINAINLAGEIEEKEISGSNIYLDRNNKSSLEEAKKILEELRKS